MSSSTDYVCEMVVWEFQTPLGWRCWCWPCSLSGEVRRGTESKGPLGCCFQTTQWQYEKQEKLQRAKWMRPELSKKLMSGNFVSWTFSNSLYPSQKGKQHRLAVSFDFIGAFSGRVASHQVEQPRYGRVLIRGQIMGSLWCWMIMPVYETFQLFILDSRAWSCRNWWIASQCTHVEGSWGTCWWSKMILSSMGISSIFRRIHMNCMNWYMFTFHPVTLWQPFQHSQLKTSPWENPPIDCEWHDVVACAVCAGSMSCGSSSSPKS